MNSLSAVGSGATTQSMGDYLVENMSPSEELVSFKQAGLKFRTKVYRLFGGTQPTNPISHMTEFGMSLTDSIKYLPPWYSREEFQQRFVQLAQTAMKKDPEFEKAVDRIEGQTGLGDFNRVSSLADAFELISLRAKASHLNRAETYSEVFLDSDVPESTFLLLDEADRVNTWRFELTTARLRHLDAEVARERSRGFGAFKRSVSRAQLELAPMMEAGRDVAKTTMKFEFYLSLANADNLDQFLENNPFHLSRINGEYYRLLAEEARSSLAKMHRSFSHLLLADKTLRMDAGETVDQKVEDFTKAFQNSIAETLLVTA